MKMIAENDHVILNHGWSFLLTNSKFL